MYSFTVPGKPLGKERPRFAGDYGRVSTYTPKKTAAYEAYIQLMYKMVCGGHRFPEDVHVGLLITAIYPIPAKASKQKAKNMLLGYIKPTSKPDVDNILKVVMDALNGMAYKDDAQVVYARAEKRYGARPMVVVTLFDVEEEDLKLMDEPD